MAAVTLSSFPAATAGTNRNSAAAKVLTDDAQAVDGSKAGFTTSPHEECAVEIATQLVGAADGGEATVLTLGDKDAAEQLGTARRERVRAMVGRGRELSEAELDMVMDSPAGQQILHMLHWSAAGTGDEVRSALEDFAATADADELMIAPASPTQEQVLRSLDLLAGAWGTGTTADLPSGASRR